MLVSWLDVRACATVTSYTGLDIVSPPPSVRLSAAWLMLVFGDSSPTRVLTLATGSPLCVDVLGHEAIPEGDTDGTPLHSLDAIRCPRVRRRVWLRNARGERLGYATSWWHDADLSHCLPDERLPIGGALSDSRRETFRELILIVRGTGGHALLDAEFNNSQEGTPLWARWYLVYSAGRALCLVYECFSPLNSKWLGDCNSSDDSDSK
jgi:chorismate--pyruvate lyase